MNIILTVIVSIFLLVIAAFLIPLLLELKKTVISLRNITENNLKPALDELQITLKSVRGITDNVNDITADVKEVSGSIAEVSARIHAVTGFIDTLGSSASVKAVSLKAGITAALTFLVNNLLRKGDRQ